MSIIQAKVRIKAHDKVVTWRKVWHRITLDKLHAHLTGKPELCPTCGQEIEVPRV